MQNFPYDENTPETAEETQPPKTKEEFDISSFDFTIADPGEIKEFSEIREETEAEAAPEEAEAPTKKSFSLSRLTAALSEKAEKLMEETPREKKEKPKKEKPKKEKPVPAPKPKEEPREKPIRTPIRFSGGSARQIARRWLRYALRPASLYDTVTERLYPLFLAGVMLFFGGFYLLIGLDWYFADLVSAGRLWAMVAVGLLVGGTAALGFSAGAQGLSMICRKERLYPFRVLSTVAGACVYPSSLLILGLLIQLIFRASVSMSFGITAVLWLISLLLDVLRDLFGEKNLFKSTLLIVLWGFILFSVMTLTFTLK